MSKIKLNSRQAKLMKQIYKLYKEYDKISYSDLEDLYDQGVLHTICRPHILKKGVKCE